MSQPRVAAGILTILALLASACAINPVTGRPEFVLVSTAQEVRMGKEEAKRVEQELGIVDDPALAAYVRAIGERLAVHSPRRDDTTHLMRIEGVNMETVQRDKFVPA